MEHTTTVGTITGTIFSLIMVKAATIITAVIVAATGAITSFLVTLICKWIYHKITDQKI